MKLTFEIDMTPVADDPDSFDVLVLNFTAEQEIGDPVHSEGQKYKLSQYPRAVHGYTVYLERTSTDAADFHHYDNKAQALGAILIHLIDTTEA